jgi:NitT/TauT family transport system permease protein
MLFRSSSQTPQTPVNLTWRLVPLLSIAAIWEFAPRLGLADRQFVPTFTDVLTTLWELLLHGALLRHILTSLARVALSFLFALGIGVTGGALLGNAHSQWRVLLDPFLRVLSQVNPFSLLPVFLMIFGSGEAVKIAALSWVATWPVLFFTTVGIVNADPVLLKVARSFVADPLSIFVKVTLPSAIPAVFVGVRIAAGLVFFVLIGAEMLGTDAGLGWLVHNSGMNYQIKGIYAAALAVVLVGYGFSRSLMHLESRIFALFGAREKLVHSGGAWWSPRQRSRNSDPTIIKAHELPTGTAADLPCVEWVRSAPALTLATVSSREVQ